MIVNSRIGRVSELEGRVARIVGIELSKFHPDILIGAHAINYLLF